MWVCDLSLEDLPSEGTNRHGVEWDDIRDRVENLCGLDTEDDGGYVNMTPTELDSWEHHPCADTKSLDPQLVRDRVRKVTTTHPRDWETEGSWRDDDPRDMGHMEIASKVISYNARGYGSWKGLDDTTTEKTVDGQDIECPNGWGIANLNWMQDPERTYERRFYHRE